MPRVVFPLPDLDFDPTEVAVPWHLLRAAGIQVVFATERGAVPATDPLLLTGVVFGQLGAEEHPKALYATMRADPAYRSPLCLGRHRRRAVRRTLVVRRTRAGHAPVPRQRVDPGTGARSSSR